jgi:hypothetical protein
MSNLKEACIPMDAKSDRLAGTMLFLAAVFNIIDYFFTTKVLNLGAEEWNPIVEYLIDIELFVVIKILIIPVVLLLIWKLRSWCYCQRKLS